MTDLVENIHYQLTCDSQGLDIALALAQLSEELRNLAAPSA
jgi:hypothetical protein